MRWRTLAPASYQLRVLFTIFTTVSITGTSINTPTTVAKAGPELNPKRLIAAATANSKKLLAPMSADGAATQCASPAVVSPLDRHRRLPLLPGAAAGRRLVVDADKFRLVFSLLLIGFALAAVAAWMAVDQWTNIMSLADPRLGRL
jgi:hypothetical protein